MHRRGNVTFVALLLALLFSLACVPLSHAQPAIAFSPPTQDEAATVSNRTMLVNISVNETAHPLGSFTYDWNGTDYTSSDSSLVLMCHLDNVSALGETSTSVADVSSFGRVGTVYGGASFTPSGKYGGAYTFDGVDGYIGFPNAATNATDNWTLAAWINPAVLPQATTIAVYNGRDYGGYGFGVIGDHLEGLFGGVVIIDSGYAFPSANQWYYVTMTRRDGTTYLYVDGVVTPGTSSASPDSTLDGFSIGCLFHDYGPPFFFFNGSVDEVMALNRSLSASEIQQLYLSNPISYGANYTPYDPSLLLMYNFDNVSSLGENGSQVTDLSMYGNNTATCTDPYCPTWTLDGRYGGAYHFDGVDEQFTTNDLSTVPLTFSTWIKLDSTHIGWLQGLATDNGQGWVLYLGSDNTLRFGQAYIADAAPSTGRIMDTDWHQVAVTYDGSSVDYYIDGAPAGTSPFSNPINHNGIYYIGSYIGGFLNGSMDEMRFYNRTLSASEIQQLYESNLNKYAPGQWQFSINQPFGPFQPGDYNFTYSGCAQDTLAFENCTSRDVTYQPAPPAIAFSPPTPDNGSTTSASSILINISMNSTSNPLGVFTLGWNGTNRTLPGNGVYDSSLVLAYEFDNLPYLGEDGHHVTDLSTYGDNATCTDPDCPMWTLNGKYGGAYHFDGVQDYFDTGNLDYSQLTVSAWIDKESDSPQWMYILHSRNDGGFGFGITNDNHLYLEWRGHFTTISTDTVTDGAWQHVAVTYNGTSAIFYIDGIPEENPGFSVSYGGGGDYVIGTSGGGDSYFNGTMDDLRVYDRALPASEIAQLYNSTNWQFSTTQSFGLFPSGDHNFTYSACIADMFGSENCTSRDVTFRIIPPAIAFSAPTPDEGASTTNYTMPINISVNETSNLLSTFVFNWNGTNRTLPGNGIYDSSLVLAYEFDNLSYLGEDGHHVTDLSTYGNNATCSGSSCPAWTPDGKFGGAYQFDGTQTYFNSGVNLDHNVPLTFTAWIKRDRVGSNDGIFASMNCGGWGVRIDSDNTLRLTHTCNSDRASSSTITDTAWHFVSVTYDGSNVNFYIDGVPAGSQGYSDTFNSGAGHYGVGEQNMDGGFYFQGLIDDLRVYDRVLPPSEIAQLYDSTNWQFFTNQPFGSLPAGEYNFTYSACVQDAFGSENCTETRNITHDVIAPEIAFAPPTPDEAAATNDSSIPINVTVNETSNPLTRLVLDWNGTNLTYEPTNDLVLLYHFDNLSALGEDSSHIADSSVYGNRITCSGTSCPKWTSAGRFNGAYHFDGTDYLTVPDSPSLDPTNGLTLSVWVNVSDNFPYYEDLITKLANPITPYWGSPYATYALRTNGVHAEFWTANPGYALDSNTVLSSGQWYMLTATYDGSQEKLYINGVLDNWRAQSGAIPSSPYPLMLGSHGTSPSSEFFNGTMDEVRIYNRSLSASEIQQLYLGNPLSYNPGSTQFLLNQPFGFIPLSGYYNFTYSACVQDSGANENCTETRNVTYHNINCPVISAPGLYTMDRDYSGAPNSVSPLAGNACVKITASNVVFDCAGHAITNHGIAGTTYGIMVSSSASNVTVQNCPGISAYTYGAVAYQSNGDLFANDTVYGCSYGFSPQSSNGDLFTNDTVSGSGYGFYLQSSNNDNLTNNTAHDNSQYGVYIQKSNNTQISYDRYFNNSVASFYITTDGTNRTVNLTGVVFDNPTGSMAGYTNLSINDQLKSETYTIKWANSPPTLPQNRVSFAQKFVNISKVSGTVSIDSIRWSWTDPESSGHNESSFQLWKYNGTWSNTGAALDTGADTLALTNLNPASTYGILETIQTCQVVDSPGTFTMANSYLGAPNDASEMPDGGMACVKIAASNVVFDCNGDTITGNGTTGISYGIAIVPSLTNVTVQNCPLISNYTYGLYAYQSDNDTFASVTAHNNSIGFALNSTQDSNFTSCNASGNSLWAFSSSDDSTGIVVQNLSLGNNTLSFEPKDVNIQDSGRPRTNSGSPNIEIDILSTQGDGTKVTGLSGGAGSPSSITSFGPTIVDYNGSVAYYAGTNGSVLSSNTATDLTPVSGMTVLGSMYGDEGVSDDITLPFNVTLFGRQNDHIRISTNGFIYMNNETVVSDDSSCCDEDYMSSQGITRVRITWSPACGRT